jgi:hypothetical protein
LKLRVFVPEPLAKATDASLPPVSSARRGEPATATASENVTWIDTGALIAYVPLGVAELTLVTVGSVVSMTMFLLAPSEAGAPGDGKVSVALLPAASLIVPLFRVSEVELT